MSRNVAVIEPLLLDLYGGSDEGSRERQGNYGLKECQVLQIAIYIRV